MGDWFVKKMHTINWDDKKFIKCGVNDMQKTLDELIKRRELALLEIKTNKKTKRFNKRLIERLNKESGLRLIPLS